jgi:hypothetical protein
MINSLFLSLQLTAMWRQAANHTASCVVIAKAGYSGSKLPFKLCKPAICSSAKAATDNEQINRQPTGKNRP